MRKLLLLAGILLVTLVSCSKDSMDSPDVMSVEKETPMVDSTAGKGPGAVIKGLNQDQLYILKESGFTMFPATGPSDTYAAYYRERTPQEYRGHGLDQGMVEFLYYYRTKTFRVQKWGYYGKQNIDKKFTDFEEAARYALNAMTISQPFTDNFEAYGFIRQPNSASGLLLLHKSGVTVSAGYDDTYIEVKGSGKTERFEEADKDVRIGVALQIAIEFSKEPQN